MQNDNPSLPVPVTVPVAKHFTANRSFQGIPGIETTAGGRIFATWYTGGVGEGPDNFVVVVRSDDGGRSWSEPVAVVDPPGEHIRAFDEALWRDPANRLWLFWAQSYSPALNQINDGAAGVWAARCDDPDAAELKWNAPVYIAPGVMMNKPVVLAGGSWALPVAVWDRKWCCADRPPELEALSGANLYKSSDSGESFHYVGGLAAPYRLFDEHQIVELRDGVLWMLIRTTYGIAEGFSRDGGKTWSTPMPAAWRVPSSRFFIRRLASGKLLWVGHDIDPAADAARERMTAWLSDDDGRSWYGRLLLDERSGVSYPDGAHEYDGAVWVVYDHERYRGGEIIAVRLTEEEIAAGGVLAPERRVLVSRTKPVPEN